MNTRFEPTYDDHVMEKVYQLISDWSQISLYSEFEIQKFQELIKESFTINSVTEKYDYYTSKKTKKLIYFYKNTVQYGNDIVISYNVSNKLQNAQEVYDGEETEIEEVNLDDIKVQENVCTDIQIYYNFKTKEKVEEFLATLDEVIYVGEERNLFYTIGVDNYGFKLMEQETNNVESDIELHYGKKFMEIHQQILDNLTNKYHGLFLFHGDPGTGKTSYIRYLISILSSKKKVIYIPTYMIEQLANPEFITFIQKHKESILILEDAEFALQSRTEEYGAQAVSNLLNITNGLLNDATKIQVIATFNMDKKKLDEALLRPGRLLNEWKFDKLSIEESKALASHLGKDFDVTEAMTVAEIYEGKVQTNKKKKKSTIGF